MRVFSKIRIKIQLIVFLILFPFLGWTQEKNNIIKVSPNVLNLEADFGYSFNDGFAVIQKGESHCLIDKTGKTVIPYNVYKFYSNDVRGIPWYLSGMNIDTYGFVNGYCIVTDVNTNLMGMIDVNLNVVVPCEYSSLRQIHHSGLLMASKKSADNKNENLILNVSGKVIKNVELGFKTFEPAIRPQWLEKDKYGYVDYFGNLLISPQFEQAEPFRDGMAAVAQRNEFGEIKWGFIDEKGSLEIPFQFSKQPGNFSDGLVLVEPISKDEFQFAYIDKKGDVVLFIKNEPNRFFSPNQMGTVRPNYARRQIGDFVDGYTVWNGSYRGNSKYPVMLIDKLGNANYLIDRLEGQNWPSSSFQFLTEFINREALISSSSGVRYDEVYAIVNVHGDIIIRSADKNGETNLIIDSLFDPVSNLARVSFYSNENRKRTIAYVNRFGEAIIRITDSKIW